MPGKIYSSSFMSYVRVLSSFCPLHKLRQALGQTSRNRCRTPALASLSKNTQDTSSGSLEGSEEGHDTAAEQVTG